MSVEAALASDSGPSKLSVGMLKAHLKENQMSQSGEKQTLWVRCKLLHSVQTRSLRTADGLDPTKLKPAALKKTCARAGVSPIGSNDELLMGFVDCLLKSHTSTTSTTSTKSTSTSTKSTPKPSGPTLASAVLSLADTSTFNPIVVLQLSDPSLTPSSPTASLRRSYLKMSLLIHPDRIGREFKEATKAFQVLVEAFERLTSPTELPSDDTSSSSSSSKKKKKSTPVRISRSNERCHRAPVHCPRCKSQWGNDIEGNPEYFYNIFMQGLKSFHCSTCLLKFGCMSATHKCPHCKVRVCAVDTSEHKVAAVKLYAVINNKNAPSIATRFARCSTRSSMIPPTITVQFIVQTKSARKRLASTSSTCLTWPFALCATML